MRRFLLIYLQLILFAMTGVAYASTVQLPRTGQNVCYDDTGAVIACANSGQDGDKLAGKPWPTPRFTDNSNGTVTDNLTGLIWMKNANCTATVGGIAKASGSLTWASAFTWSNGLASGACALTDGSVAGDWRLPNITELESLIDAQRFNPVVPTGHPFTGVQPGWYLSSSTLSGGASTVWSVYMYDGLVLNNGKGTSCYVWPVRAGQ